MKTKICSVICVLCLVLCLVVVLTDYNASVPAQLISADINANGELILVYGDGTEQNLGVVVGKDGADGKDGMDGKDGADGKDGTNGKDGTDGKDGKDGADGKDGKDGKDSSDISAASAKGLRSAVSVVCYFEKNVQQGGWFGSPGTTIQGYISAGSGVIYRMDDDEGDAFIITNYHVVYDASSNSANGISEEISLYLYGAEFAEKAIPATYVGGSMYYDLAVLRVEDSDVLRESDVCAAEIADSDVIAVGSSAIAIGNPQGYGISASYGIVSVDSEYIGMIASDGKTEVIFRVMRVDTAVNLGNSGGGLYNDNGKLIGIVNAKIVDDGVENIGYAIPSNIAASVADNIIDYCYGTENTNVQRALLGITVGISDSKAVFDPESGEVSVVETVFVQAVSEGSLAYDVLQEGDMLISATLHGKMTKITRQHHMIDMMLGVRVGDTVMIEILRNGEKMTVAITVTEDCLTAY